MHNANVGCACRVCIGGVRARHETDVVVNGLRDKVIVIAGGGRGMGAATAMRLLKEGAYVVVGDLDVNAVSDLLNTLDPGGERGLAVGFDVTAEESVATLLSSAVERFGGLDGVHCNAADTSQQTFGNDTDIVDVDMAVWHRSLEVNLTGMMLVIRHAIPHLLTRGGGAIVTVSSTAGAIGNPNHHAYSVSKAGVNALTRNVAKRWGKHGVRCNAVSPGPVLTEAMYESFPPEHLERRLTELSSARLGRPEDVAAAVAFLLSDDAEWITGQTIAVNGGRTFS